MTAEWFSARIILESVHSEDDPEPVFEESILLIRAQSEEEARSRAEALARDSEHEYDTAAGGHARWEFREVLEIIPLWLDGLGDGSEVYYRFIRKDELEHMRRMLELRL